MNWWRLDGFCSIIEITNEEIEKFEESLKTEDYKEMDRLMPELAEKARELARRLDR